MNYWGIIFSEIKFTIHVPQVTVDMLGCGNVTDRIFEGKKITGVLESTYGSNDFQTYLYNLTAAEFSSKDRILCIPTYTYVHKMYMHNCKKLN